jgi:hypothetical protein
MSKVESMYTDINNSLEQTHLYKGSDPRKRKNPEFETEFLILEAATWPIKHEILLINLPKEISTVQ